MYVMRLFLCAGPSSLIGSQGPPGLPGQLEVVGRTGPPVFVPSDHSWPPPVMPGTPARPQSLGAAGATRYPGSHRISRFGLPGLLV